MFDVFRYVQISLFMFMLPLLLKIISNNSCNRLGFFQDGLLQKFLIQHDFGIDLIIIQGCCIYFDITSTPNFIKIVLGNGCGRYPISLIS